MDVPMRAFVVTLFLQTLDIQVLHTDNIVVVNIRSGEFMEEVRSLVIDLFMNFIQLIPELLSVIGALFSSR